MPCSGLKSATSFTSFAPWSRSIVRRAVARAAGVVGDEADPLALQRREALARAARRCRSAPARAARRGGSVPAAPKSRPVISARPRRVGRRVDDGRRRDRRDARAQRRHVALAVGVHAVRQEHHEHPRRRIDPQRRAGEAGVAERADREAARRGSTRSVESMSQPRPRTLRIAGRRRRRRHLRDGRAATGCARRRARRRRAACGRRRADRRRC